jgi:hypothetical protein
MTATAIARQIVSWAFAPAGKSNSLSCVRDGIKMPTLASIKASAVNTARGIFELPKTGGRPEAYPVSVTSLMTKMPQERAMDTKRQNGPRIGAGDWSDDLVHSGAARVADHCPGRRADHWQYRAMLASRNAMDVRGDITPTGIPVGVDRSPNHPALQEGVANDGLRASSRLSKATIDRQPMMKRRATGENGQRLETNSDAPSTTNTNAVEGAIGTFCVPNARACQSPSHQDAPTTTPKADG